MVKYEEAGRTHCGDIADGSGGRPIQENYIISLPIALSAFRQNLPGDTAGICIVSVNARRFSSHKEPCKSLSMNRCLLLAYTQRTQASLQCDSLDGNFRPLVRICSSVKDIMGKHTVPMRFRLVSPTLSTGFRGRKLRRDQEILHYPATAPDSG